MPQLLFLLSSSLGFLQFQILFVWIWWPKKCSSIHKHDVDWNCNIFCDDI